jgi:hypothetical protein
VLIRILANEVSHGRHRLRSMRIIAHFLVSLLISPKAIFFRWEPPR